MFRNAIVMLCILIVLLAVYLVIREVRRKLQGRHCSGCGGWNCSGCTETAPEEGRRRREPL